MTWWMLAPPALIVSWTGKELCSAGTASEHAKPPHSEAQAQLLPLMLPCRVGTRGFARQAMALEGGEGAAGQRA